MHFTLNSYHFRPQNVMKEIGFVVEIQTAVMIQEY